MTSRYAIMNIIERQWLLAHLHLVQHTTVANKAGLLLNPERKNLRFNDDKV